MLNGKRWIWEGRQEKLREAHLKNRLVPVAGVPSASHFPSRKIFLICLLFIAAKET